MVPHATILCDMIIIRNIRNEYKCKQGIFSGITGAGTHKRRKDKHTESSVTISLYNITMYLHAL
jgi:N-acetyl-gamma-glutamylphosphate reductase